MLRVLVKTGTTSFRFQPTLRKIFKNQTFRGKKGNKRIKVQYEKQTNKETNKKKDELSWPRKARKEENEEVGDAPHHTPYLCVKC